ncbi:MAG: branched-chain amino acid ABC transporter permease [Alphaproteobacteria bacterium]|nr:branched-chain amino acid ABC transporter permease [Alphaproteobacteria bacterium]
MSGSTRISQTNTSLLHQPWFLFAVMAALLAFTGFAQSWLFALTIVQLCMISAIMALGVNIQWGYAGLFNAGTMGFAALGGVAAILVAADPVPEAWSAGGAGIALSALVIGATIATVIVVRAKLGGLVRLIATALVLIIGYLLFTYYFGPATSAIEAVNPSRTGYLGGMGISILFGWLVGGLLAAGAAWIIGKIAIGLRSDYLAIATLGIAEIILAVIKNEDWLTRGVKNVTGLPRPVPREVDLQTDPAFISLAQSLGMEPIALSSIAVKLAYISLFAIVLIALVYLSEKALYSPWGRMMRAIRDRPDAAEAMGKDVKRRHLQVFVLGSAICGIAGAMLVTLDGQFTPGSYQPLRFTFLVWVMVIVGGSGNNMGSVLGGFLIWFVWVQSESAGFALMDALSGLLAEDSPIRGNLTEAAPHLRPVLMGLILILALRFAPRGLIPER